MLIIGCSYGCASSRRDNSSKRSLMISDQNDLPRNSKLRNPRYQQKVRKSQKNYRKGNKKAYKR